VSADLWRIPQTREPKHGIGPGSDALAIASGVALVAAISVRSRFDIEAFAMKRPSGQRALEHCGRECLQLAAKPIDVPFGEHG
jgi:hypothetical protein